MTANLSCEALRDDIIALLYDDGDAAERTRARDHLAQCVPCRAEYSDLKGVRKALVGWTLPTPAPVVTLVDRDRKTNPLKLLWGGLPTALAAAAGIVLGVGATIAWRGAFLPAAPTQTASAVASAGGAGRFVSHDELQEILTSQESRHQNEIAELRQTLTQVSQPGLQTISGSPQNVSNLSPATLERLLKASEERQARIFETRLAGLRTDNDLQRQYDMAQIAAGLAYIDSRTGADAARTSELMKNLVRVTAKPQDR